MKRNDFKVRVCVHCVEKKGTAFAYLSIYGCKLGDDVRSCEECPDFEVCSIRKVNPDRLDVTSGYCQPCVNAYLEKMHQERIVDL